MGEAAGKNIYSYCNNDPVNLIDLLGLAGYFFGGTGNSLEPEGISNVEVLFFAWDESAHGNAHYVPGVFSGYSPTGRKYRFYRHRLLEGAAGRTLGDRAGEMMRELEKELRRGDKEVNVFGVSRGATTALEFLNRIQDRINAHDPLYDGIKMNLVNLWDTVKTTAHNYRTELPAGMRFEHQPLHFIAIDEQRAEFFDEEVLNVQGALQIGYRGVHADTGNAYPNSPFGWLSLNTAVSAAGLIGIRFDEEQLRQYPEVVNWRAVPTPNDQWFYNGGEQRRFPKDMYLHWSVPLFNRYTKPLNDVSEFAPLPDIWMKWAAPTDGGGRP